MSVCLYRSILDVDTLPYLGAVLRPVRRRRPPDVAVRVRPQKRPGRATLWPAPERCQQTGGGGTRQSHRLGPEQCLPGGRWRTDTCRWTGVRSNRRVTCTGCVWAKATIRTTKRNWNDSKCSHWYLLLGGDNFPPDYQLQHKTILKCCRLHDAVA